MNRGDIVKIIKKVPLFNNISWAVVFKEELINNGSLYAVYLRPATTAPILAYNGGTYYAPAESFERQENAFCLIPISRRGKIVIVSYDGMRQLTANDELVEISDATPSLSFDSHEEAKTYIRENFVAVIDDMNVSHFKRAPGQAGVICQNILSEMDKPNCNRLFFLTTNETISEANIDKAFFRPGRIQNVIVFKRPNEELKKRIIDDINISLISNGISDLPAEFLTGVKLLASEDHDLSLAETMRLKNLILTDIILENELSHPRLYIDRCKKLKVKEGEEADVTTV